jgi:K+-sensing histidine kinase KdpD
MKIKPVTTQFAPAERGSPLLLEKDVLFFSENKAFQKIADAVSTMLVILNQQRQIIYSNQLFLQFLNLSDSQPIIGKRPGEAVDCIHSQKTEGGCGTTEFCRTCGAVGAIMESQLGKQSEKECRIVTCKNSALDLRITATPYNENGTDYTIFAVHDISNEKRRQTLERVFFHDVLNSAGGISGLSKILVEIDNREEMLEIARTINRASENMLSEIQAQRLMSDAERGDMEPDFKNIRALEIIHDVTQLYSGHELAKNKTISIDNNSEDLPVYTDPIILRRILGNMLKNALEASPPASAITLSCRSFHYLSARFSVHNNNYMERDTQLQIFQRSFSTKGKGRGIGTYSMKLLGEKYLKGKVWFESTKENGTTFFIEI